MYRVLKRLPSSPEYKNQDASGYKILENILTHGNLKPISVIKQDNLLFIASAVQSSNG
jgi:hypothetical protein